MSRKYTVLKNDPDSVGPDSLLLDSGNVFFSSKSIKIQSNHAKEKAKGIGEIYKALGYDLINVGPYDLAGGLDFIQEINTTPLLSSSFRFDDERFVFTPYTFFQNKNKKIAVIGISERASNYQGEIRHIDWKETLSSCFEKIGDQADFVILLSSYPYKTNREIAKLYPKIRLIISSSIATNSLHPQIVNNAILTQTGKKGKYLGKITITNFTYPYKTRPSGISLESLERQHYSTLHSIEKIREKKGQEFENTRKILQDKLKNIEDQLAEAQSLKEMDDSSLNAQFSYEHIALSANIQPDQSIQHLINEIKHHLQIMEKK